MIKGRFAESRQDGGILWIPHGWNEHAGCDACIPLHDLQERTLSATVHVFGGNWFSA
jgi:hypothetical protein